MTDEQAENAGGRVLREHDVAAVEDISPGGMKPVDAGRGRYVVFNIDGDLYALRDACPHQGAPLSCGSVTGTMLPSDPGQLEYGLEGHVVECPWHRWKFSIQTGEAVFGTDSRRVRTVPVVVRDGRVILCI